MARLPNKLKSLDEYTKLAAEIVNEELGAIDADSMRAAIRQKLEAKAFEFVMSALGFERRWGSDWEVRTVNGDRNPATLMIAQAGESAVREWFAEQMGQLPKLPAKTVKALHNEYLDALQYQVSRELINRARQDALAFVEDMLQDASA